LDTTYINTIGVVFLVAVGLAISVGYLYISEEDMRSVAEEAALAGTQEIKKQMLAQIRSNPARLADVTGDTMQAAARSTAETQSMGRHKEAALTHAISNNSNKLSDGNDVTVGFWNISTHTYVPGATPVNAMQVRTRRTAESDAAGIGKIGNLLGIINGVQKFDYTPDAVAALPARANASFGLCMEACESRCSYPAICSFDEKKLSSTITGNVIAPGEGPATTFFPYQYNTNMSTSDLICMGTPPLDICKKEVFTGSDAQDNALRDMKSMMYNPNADVTNKEIDKTSGKILGWWVIAPVTDCSTTQASTILKRLVKRYALVRIKRICVPGRTGCQQNQTSFDSPASVCGNEKGVFIDRISCVNCNTKDLLTFPGLNPILVN
jgi:hypothetical protein